MNDVARSSRRMIEPRSVYIDSWTGFDDQIAPIMAILRRRYGTRFTIMIANEDRRAEISKWCTPEDTILVSSTVRTDARNRPISAEAEFKKARMYEERYGLVYLRDVIMQDRSIAGYFIDYAPNSPHSRAKPPAIERLVAEINYYFDFFQELVDREKFDFMIAQPGGLQNTVTVHCGLYRSVPSTYAMGSRFGTLYSFVSDPYQNDDWVREAFERTDADSVMLEEPEPYPFSTSMMSQSNVWRTWRYLLRGIAQDSVNRVIWLWRDLKRWKRGSRLSFLSVLGYRFRLFQTFRTLDRLVERDPEKIVSQPFVLFLLQVEPELTTLSFAKEFNNTRAIVQQLALALPAGFRLVVKEHIMNVGNRAAEFYTSLLRLPNVVLADHQLRGIDLAARAHAVATLTGTIGIEATMLGKQAIVFSDHTHYGFLPNIHVVDRLHDLPAIVAEAVRERSAQEIERIRLDGARFKQAAIALSYDVPDAKERGGKGGLAPDQAERAVDLLIDNVRAQRERMTGPKAGSRGGETLLTLDTERLAARQAVSDH